LLRYSLSLKIVGVAWWNNSAVFSAFPLEHVSVFKTVMVRYGWWVFLHEGLKLWKEWETREETLTNVKMLTLVLTIYHDLLANESCWQLVSRVL